MKWDNWISELERLPATSPEWESPNVSAFIEAVQNVARDKCRERESGRKRLAEAILKLSDEWQDQLRFHLLTEHSQWSSEFCELGQIPLLLEKIEHLQTELARYSELSKSLPASRQLWMKSLDGVAKTIDEDYRALSESLTSAKPTSEPPTEATSAVVESPRVITSPEVPAAVESVAPAAEALPGVESIATGPAVTSPDESTTAETAAIGELEKETISLSERSNLEPTSRDETRAEAVTVKATNEPLEVIPEELTEEFGSKVEIIFGPKLPPVVLKDSDLPEAIAPMIEPAVASPITPVVVAPNGSEKVVGQDPTPPVLPKRTIRIIKTSQPEPVANPPVRPLPKPNLYKLQLPTELGRYLQESPDDQEAWVGFLWSLVGVNDLTGAYWLSNALHAGYPEADLPPAWMFAAVQASEWLTGDEDPIATQILELAADHPVEEPEADEIGILRLAASLTAPLIAPSCGTETWIEIPECCSSLTKLFDATKEFLQNGTTLYPENFDRNAKLNQTDQEAKAAAAGVNKWLIESAQKKFLSAGNVWKEVFLDIQGVLTPIANDQRKDWKLALESVSSWLDLLDQKIDAADFTHSHGRRTKKIDQNAREKVVREVVDVCNQARKWCDLVRQHESQAKTLQQGDEWYNINVQSLRKEAQAVLPEVQKQLTTLIEESGRPARSAAALCLANAIRRLEGLLSLTQTPENVHSHSIDNSWLLEGAEIIEEAISRRLFLLPRLSLHQKSKHQANGNEIMLVEPSPEDLQKLPAALANFYGPPFSVDSILKAWFKKQDFRFIEHIQRLQSGSERAATDKQYNKLLTASREALREKLKRVVEQIESAYFNGTIDEERAEYLAVTEAIVPREELDVADASKLLDQVLTDLNDARRAHAKRLSTIWNQVRSQLARHPEIPADALGQIRTFLESAIKQEDVRVVGECLSSLTEELNKTDVLSDLTINKLGWDVDKNRDVFAEFLRISKSKIDPWLQRNNGHRHNLQVAYQTAEQAILDGRELFGVHPPQLDDRQSVAQALNAFAHLAGRPPLGITSVLINSLEVLLEFLGFLVKTEKGPTVRINQTEPNFVHATATIDPGMWGRPLPQFAVKEYDIVGVWENSPAKIEPILQKLSLGRTVILFYFRPLTENERRSFAGIARKRPEAIALIDTNLMLFLTGEPANRLSAFLRCALPYSKVMPYTSTLDGYVAPSMFFGREDEIEQLRSVSGKSLVYGGRQLGKTATLNHIHKLYDKPDDGQHVLLWTLDKKFGALKLSTKEFWGKLRYELINRKLLTEKSSQAPAQIPTDVQKVVSSAQVKQILLLLDESDEFLAHDASNNFAIVRELRDLKVNTEGRFKVVLAGNRNVDRFHRIPNQPISQLGEPIIVGPMKPKPARELVSLPFEVLGFRFKDNATVLRILSYTNYHAGLIQVFCKELLERMYEMAPTIPQYIQDSDVEAVYASPATRASLKERFDLTVTLRKEYELIAGLMIVDQLGSTDGFAKAYTATDLWERCRDHWPEGFGDTSIQMMQVTLEEMCTLGVLVSDKDSRLRLRSPNVVRMMGNKEDVIKRISEIADEPRPVEGVALDSEHSWLTDSYSPLTYAQEAAVNIYQTGVAMILGTEALGLEDLPVALKHLASNESDSLNTCQEIPADITNPDELGAWLDQYLKSQEQGSDTAFRSYVTYQRVNRSDVDLRQLIQRATAFCNTFRSTKRAFRVVFICGPLATWAWLSLPVEERLSLGTLIAQITLRVYDAIGVRKRLIHSNLLSTEPVCNQLIEATGGFKFLVDAFFAGAPTSASAMGTASYLSAFEELLSSSNDSLAASFRAALGLDQIPLAREILAFVHAHNVKELNDITPDILFELTLSETFRTVTHEQCQQTIEFLQLIACVDVETRYIAVRPVIQRLLSSVSVDSQA